MRKLGFILNFIFIFHSVAFAGEVDCNDKQAEISVIDAHIRNYFKKHSNPYVPFIKKANLQNQLLKLKSIEPKAKKIEDLTKEVYTSVVNYSILSVLPGSCQEYNKSLLNKNKNLKFKKKCDEILFKYLSDETYTHHLDKNISDGLKQDANTISLTQSAPEFQALKNLKKYIALEILDGCELEAGQRRKFHNISCAKNLEGVPKDNLDKYVVDSLEIVNELNKKINKVKLTTIERSCAMLTGIGLATESGDDNKKINFGYAADEFATCEDVLAEQRLRVKKEVKIAEKEKVKTEREERKRKRNEKHKKTAVNKEKRSQIDYYSSDEKFVYKTKQSESNKDKKKLRRSHRKSGKRFWKNAGVVAAAVGVSGLMGYGLYKAFEPLARSSYVAPTNTYTEPRYFNNYQMNPYEQYQLQNYMIGGYQTSPNWIGYTPEASNSPYTFEFGQ